MKFLKNLLALAVLLCCFSVQSTHAQMITNTTGCAFNVKANYVPSGTCGFTGAGPLVLSAPGSVIALPIPAPGEWVVGYGVHRGARVPRVVGDNFTCGMPVTQFAGLCGGAPVTVQYIGGDLNIF